jgi:hypothetical protein
MLREWLSERLHDRSAGLYQNGTSSIIDDGCNGYPDGLKQREIWYSLDNDSSHSAPASQVAAEVELEVEVEFEQACRELAAWLMRRYVATSPKIASTSSVSHASCDSTLYYTRG